jgi:hypothetical protein
MAGYDKSKAISNLNVVSKLVKKARGQGNTTSQVTSFRKHASPKSIQAGAFAYRNSSMVSLELKNDFSVEKKVPTLSDAKRVIRRSERVPIIKRETPSQQTKLNLKP